MSASDEEWFSLSREDEEHLTGASETFLSRLRSMSGIWQSLGIRADDTNALCLPGQLIICIDIVHQAEHLIIGTLRVDHLGTSISAAWVSSSIAWEQPDIKQADPEDEASFVVKPSGSVNGIDEALAWLEAQLHRPVQWLRWTQRGKTIESLRMLADTGRRLCYSGSPSSVQDTRTANAVSQIRP